MLRISFCTLYSYVHACINLLSDQCSLCRAYSYVCVPVGGPSTRSKAGSTASRGVSRNISPVDASNDEGLTTSSKEICTVQARTHTHTLLWCMFQCAGESKNTGSSKFTVSKSEY